MVEPEVSERAELEAAEATHLAREFARLFDDVIEKALGDLFAAVAESGLGFAELRALRALAEAPSPAGQPDRPSSPAEIAQATGLSPTSLQGTMATLESRGLITSQRRGAVGLTGRGKAVLRELRGRRLEALTAFVRDRDLGERLRLAGALHLLDVRFDVRLRPRGAAAGSGRR
jgi:DNA-binding MarR family transcriptional regulator